MAGEDFLTVSHELGVVITAYCPLNDWPSKMKAVDDAHVHFIARKHSKTPAQVVPHPPGRPTPCRIPLHHPTVTHPVVKAGGTE